MQQYEIKNFSFVEIDMPGISAADVTLALQDGQLSMFARNDFKRGTYVWQTDVDPTIPVNKTVNNTRHVAQAAIDL